MGSLKTPKALSARVLSTGAFSGVFPRLFSMTMSVFAGFVLVLQTGCAPGSRAFSSTYQLPWADDSGNYSLQKVDVKTFSHPSDLSGEYGEILVHPHDDANQQLASSKAAGHFIKAGDVEVAADVLSLQAATIYAHIERLHEMDEMTGAASALSWPLKFGLDVTTTDGTTSNALYDPKRNAVVIMPYTAGRLPISINGGILAHEHFHTIFQALVTRDLPQVLQVPTPGLMQSANPAVNLSGKSEWSEDVLTAATQAAQRMNQVRAGDGNVSGNISGSISGASSPTADSAADPSAGKAAPAPIGTPNFDANSGFIEIPVATYNNFLVHGVNEGLADFYAWVYGGDPTFIENSLPVNAVALRVMNVESQPMPTALDWQASLRMMGDPSKLAPASVQLGAAYQLGTYYAVFLRELAIRMSYPNSKADSDSASGPISQPGSDSNSEAGSQAGTSAADKNNSSLSPNSDLNDWDANAPADDSDAKAGNQVIKKDQRRSNAQLPLSSARNAKSLAGVSMPNIEGRAAVARAVIAALPDLKLAIKNQYQTGYMDPILLIAPLFSHLSQVNPAMCELAQNFVSGSTSSLSVRKFQSYQQAKVAMSKLAQTAPSLLPQACAGLTASSAPGASAGSSVAPSTSARAGAAVTGSTLKRASK